MNHYIMGDKRIGCLMSEDGILELYGLENPCYGEVLRSDLKFPLVGFKFLTSDSIQATQGWLSHLALLMEAKEERLKFYSQENHENLW